MKWYIFLAIVLAPLITLWYLFPFAKVFGESMLPTLHEGQVLLCKRLFPKENGLDKIDKNAIYVFKAPYDEENRLVIKRACDSVRVNGITYVQFLGDNPEKSYDSRMYGFVHSKNVVAKVLITLTR